MPPQRVVEVLVPTSPSNRRAYEGRSALAGVGTFIAVISFMLLLVTPVVAQQPTTFAGVAPSIPSALAQFASLRPILFVHGMCGGRTLGDDDPWDALRGYISTHVPGYQNASLFTLYSDQSTVRLWSSGNDVTVANIPSDTKFFAINFYDPFVTRSFDPDAVANVSILNQAAQLANVISAITSKTHIKDVILVTHSMGGLVARAYIENLASDGRCTASYSPPCAPGEPRYLDNVAALITLDTPHSGARNAACALFSWLCPLQDNLNHLELLPDSVVIRALNYDNMTSLGRATDIPPSTRVSSIASYYSTAYESPTFYECRNFCNPLPPDGLLHYWDGIVFSDEQLIRLAVPTSKLTTSLEDVGNGIDQTVQDCSPWPILIPVPRPVLHYIETLTAHSETNAIVASRVQSTGMGQVSTLRVQAFLDNAPYLGGVIYYILGPPESGITGVHQLSDSGSDVFSNIPPGSYTIIYSSGYPALSSLPVIQPLPTQSLDASRWALSFDVRSQSSVGPPATPRSLAPGVASPPGTTLGTLQPTFYWTPTLVTDSYAFDLRVSPFGDSDTVYHNATIESTQTSFGLPLGMIQNGAHYSWTVASHGAGGWSAPSPPLYFMGPAAEAQEFSLTTLPYSQAISPGQTVSYQVSTSIVSGATQSIALLVSGLPAGVSASWLPGVVRTGESALLTLSVAGDTSGGTFFPVVRATSDSGVSHITTISITISTVGDGYSAISLQPSSLQYSDQTVGTTSPAQLVTIRNSGQSVLRLLSFAASPDYAIAPGSIVLPVDLVPDGATTLSVVFAPVTDGSRAGHIQIHSTAAGSPAILPVNGNALPAPLQSGTILVRASLNAQPWSVGFAYQITFPNGTSGIGNPVPVTYTGWPAGEYTLAYVTGAPSGAALTSISPAATQMLQAGGSLEFVFNFTAPNDFYLMPVSPSSASSSPGLPATFALTAACVSGSPQTLTLNSNGLPLQTVGTFTPSTIQVCPPASAGSTLTIATSSDTPSGVYRTDLWATNSDGLTRVQKVTLLATAANAAPIELVNVASDGTQATGFFGPPLGASADGLRVVFQSDASNLATGDTNNLPDVFLHNRLTGSTERVDVSQQGVEADRGAYEPTISGDGQVVAFISDASTLTPAGRQNFNDVYTRDLRSGLVTRESIAPDGAPANGASSQPSLSYTGRYIAFRSLASNLADGVPPGSAQIYVRDRQTGQISLASLWSDGSPIGGESPVLSPDGRLVLFMSAGTPITSSRQLVLRDLVVNTAALVSAPLGVVPNAQALGPRYSMSADGRYLVFASAASNLVAGDTNTVTDCFILDRWTDSISFIGSFGDGTQYPRGCAHPSINADGRFVAYVSTIDVGLGQLQLLVRDNLTGRSVLMSRGPDNSLGNGSSTDPRISEDGTQVVFISAANNLVPADDNVLADVFAAANPHIDPIRVSSVSAATIAAGSSVDAVASLTAPAPVGGAQIAIMSSGPELQTPGILQVSGGSVTGSASLPTAPSNQDRSVALVASYGGASPLTILTIGRQIASQVIPVGGSGQMADVGQMFLTLLAATVLDGSGNPVPGQEVTFVAPALGPTALFPDGSHSNVAVTDAYGVATASSLYASNMAGAYLVIATVVSSPVSAAYSLVNTISVCQGSTPGPIDNTTQMAIEPASATSYFSWAGINFAAEYEVYRGTIPDTLLGSRVPSGGVYDHTCFESGVVLSSLFGFSVDTGVPPLGRGFFYFVSGRNPCGEGPIGVSSSGGPVPNAEPCP